MGNKNYKGQEVTVDGSMCGETVAITKIARDFATNPEYIAECPYGAADDDNHHYIQKVIYDATLSVEQILVASNRCYTDAVQVTVKNLDIFRTQITINSVNGDFSEVNAGDQIYLKSTLNNIQSSVKSKIDDKNIIVDNNGCVNEVGYNLLSKDDMTVILMHETTKDFAKRRFDHRERYLYF